MVSARCKMLVKGVLDSLGLHFVIIELGEVDIMENITTNQREYIRLKLFEAGLELMEDKRAALLLEIKLAIKEIVINREVDTKINISQYLSKKLQSDYTLLANIFSEASGTTIEKYIITQKVERIKELIMFDELNITEIAWAMNYSSVAHLSTQFKKATGLTPSHFRNLKNEKKLLAK